MLKAERVNAKMSSLPSRITKIAAAQITSTADVPRNVALVTRLIKEAAAKGARMLFLPEAFHYIGTGDGGGADAAEIVCEGSVSPASSSVTEIGKSGPSVERYATLAREHRIFLSLGGFPERRGEEKTPEDGGEGGGKRRNCNTHIVISNKGRVLAKYRKIHLFDLELPTVVMKESSYTLPGEEMVVVETPAGMLGLTTCFDLRFPLLYQCLVGAGAEILAVPSAFTVPTGKAHWHILLQARAIECQAFVVAAAQVGRHNEKRTTFGHSLIVEPFGSILADAGGEASEDGGSLIFADIDLAAVRDVRTRMPIQRQARFDVTGKPASDKVKVVMMTEEERAAAELGPVA